MTLAPLAYEPFSTLAMIYEDQGDMEKALQFGLIAAHLNPSDCEEWVKLADMSLEQDNIKQAIICYSKGQWLKPMTPQKDTWSMYPKPWILQGLTGMI